MRAYARVQLALRRCFVRKIPKQKRSREMVESLIEATARCIVEDGLDALSTNRVAERAGVSVGSLYQYFPDKEALVSALLDRCVHDVQRLTVREAPVLQRLDLETLVRTLLHTVFAFLHTRDGLYLELIRNWNRLPFGNAFDRIEQQLLELSRRYFVHHHRAYPIDDLDTRMFLVINGTLFTLVRYVSLEHPLATPDEVIDGLVTMITGYLRG